MRFVSFSKFLSNLGNLFAALAYQVILYFGGRFMILRRRYCCSVLIMMVQNSLTSQLHLDELMALQTKEKVVVMGLNESY